MQTERTIYRHPVFVPSPTMDIRHLAGECRRRARRNSVIRSTVLQLNLGSITWFHLGILRLARLLFDVVEVNIT